MLCFIQFTKRRGNNHTYAWMKQSNSIVFELIAFFTVKKDFNSRTMPSKYSSDQVSKILHFRIFGYPVIPKFRMSGCSTILIIRNTIRMFGQLYFQILLTVIYSQPPTTSIHASPYSITPRKDKHKMRFRVFWQRIKFQTTRSPKIWHLHAILRICFQKGKSSGVARRVDFQLKVISSVLPLCSSAPTIACDISSSALDCFPMT